MDTTVIATKETMADDIRDAAGSILMGGLLIVCCEGAKANVVIDELNKVGLWLFDTGEWKTGCVVHARMVIPMHPGKPSHCGIAGSW